MVLYHIVASFSEPRLPHPAGWIAWRPGTETRVCQERLEGIVE